LLVDFLVTFRDKQITICGPVGQQQPSSLSLIRCSLQEPEEQDGPMCLFILFSRRIRPVYSNHQSAYHPPQQKKKKKKKKKKNKKKNYYYYKLIHTINQLFMTLLMIIIVKNYSYSF